MQFSTAILILVLLTVLDCSQNNVPKQSNNFPFEKKVWVFWHDENFNNAPFIVQLCSQKLKKSSDKAGFEYILLNQKTVQSYIPDYDEKITKVREKSYQKGIQFLADLIRFHIIHEHGGIWMDITEILMDDFNWLLNIKDGKYKNFITNRFSEEPDVLLFYFSGYQNAAQYYTQSSKSKGQFILYNEIPGYEIWFLGAKKNTSLIGQIKQTYSKFTQMPFPQVQQIFQRQNIYMNTQDTDGYLTANLAISYVLQRKQFQLDKKFFLSSQSRFTAFQHYNLWSLSAMLGPLSWTHTQKIKVQHFIDQPVEFFEEKGASLMFFLKLVGWVKSTINDRINLLEGMYAEKNFTVEEFIQSKPTREQCQKINFLINDSVIYKTFENTSYLQSGKIKTITKQQNNKWMEYCSDNYMDYEQIILSIINFFTFLNIDVITIPWSKTHQIVNFANNPNDSLVNKIYNLLEENSQGLQFFLRIFMNFCIAYLVCLKIIDYVYQKFCNSQLQQEKVSNSASTVSPHAQKQLKGQNGLNNLASIQQKIMLSLALILIWALSLYLYFYVEFFGYWDNTLTIMIVTVIVYFLQYYVEKRINRFKALDILYETSYLYVNFWITYACFSITKKNTIWLTYCTFITALLGPFIFRFQERMQTKNVILRLSKSMSDKRFFRLLLIIFMLIINIIPELRYLTTSDYYIIEIVPYIPSLTVGIIFCFVLIQCYKTRANLLNLRVLLLGCLSLFLYFKISERNQVNALPIQKIHWGFIIVAIFQTIYVQIGQEYQIQKIKGLNNKLFIHYKLKKIDIQELIPYFSIISIQILIGSLAWMSRISSFGRLIYIQHLVLVANFFFVCLYVHVKNSKTWDNLGERKKLNQFQQVQMIETRLE